MLILIPHPAGATWSAEAYGRIIGAGTHEEAGMGPGGGFAMGWAWLWWLLVLVGVVAIAAGLIWAGRGGSGRDRGWGRDGRVDGGASSGPPVSTARQILDERFARGEIDEQEYRARRRELDA